MSDISSRQDISLSYLEQLFSKLRRRELVTSVRGPGGGYQLARELEQICVAEIVDAVNESVDATLCNGDNNCQHGHACLTHNLWDDLSKQIHSFLSSISLRDLVDRREVRAVASLQEEHAKHDLIKMEASL
ncbi:Iron-sulfur cluster regulator IscR [gamma proteobacterium IMCC2047]|nr:Iron-sulfur cluster regulator IscR [gamma proteobacterium IMCC2047]